MNIVNYIPKEVNEKFTSSKFFMAKPFRNRNFNFKLLMSTPTKFLKLA